MQQLTARFFCSFWQCKLFPERVKGGSYFDNFEIGGLLYSRVIGVGLNEKYILVFSVDELQVAYQFERNHVHAMFLFTKKPLSFNAYFHELCFLNLKNSFCSG